MKKYKCSQCKKEISEEWRGKYNYPICSEECYLKEKEKYENRLWSDFLGKKS